MDISLESSSMNTFGDKISVKQFSFMTDRENKKLHTAYYPLIEVNGKIAFISSSDYVTGKVNAETRYKAKKLGEQLLAKFKSE